MERRSRRTRCSARLACGPARHWLTEAGLQTQRGIVTDRLLQTSAPHVYAMGDCAEVAGHVSGLRCTADGGGAGSRGHAWLESPREVSYPAMPVAIKTPACPIVVSPPVRDAEGEWLF